jgi:hypothetical protein
VQKPEVLVPGGDAFQDGELVHERYLDQIRRLTTGLLKIIAGSSAASSYAVERV